MWTTTAPSSRPMVTAGFAGWLTTIADFWRFHQRLPRLLSIEKVFRCIPGRHSFCRRISRSTFCRQVRLPLEVPGSRSISDVSEQSNAALTSRRYSSRLLADGWRLPSPVDPGEAAEVFFTACSSLWSISAAGDASAVRTLSTSHFPQYKTLLNYGRRHRPIQLMRHFAFRNGAHHRSLRGTNATMQRLDQLQQLALEAKSQRSPSGDGASAS